MKKIFIVWVNICVVFLSIALYASEDNSQKKLKENAIRCDAKNLHVELLKLQNNQILRIQKQMAMSECPLIWIVLNYNVEEKSFNDRLNRSSVEDLDKILNVLQTITQYVTAATKEAI